MSIRHHDLIRPCHVGLAFFGTSASVAIAARRLVSSPGARDQAALVLERDAEHVTEERTLRPMGVAATTMRVSRPRAWLELPG